MEIFTSERSTQWLDQSDGIGGFAVIIVTYTTAMPDSWCDMIGNHSGFASGFGIRYQQAGNAQAYVKNTISKGGAPVEAGDTIVWIFNYDASTGACYLWDSKNGYATTATRTPEDFGSGNAVTLGSTINAGRFYRGLIGEVMVFDAPLSEDELTLYQAELVYKWVTPLAEKAYASLPTPGDGLTEVPRGGVTLSWKPGINAERHDVYFGASFDAVSNAIPEADLDGVYMGRQDSASLPLARLERGQTYYWRVDEVANHYNLYITRKPVIYKFSKNARLISHVMKVIYKKVKIWQRIQWTFLLVVHWQLPVRLLSNTLSLGIRLFCSGPMFG